MNKVYLVTSGNYSDYTIVSCHSTYEKAETFINNAKEKIKKQHEISKDPDGPYIPEYAIETHDLDPEVLLDKSIWNVTSYQNSIEIERINQESYTLFCTNRNIVGEYTSSAGGAPRRLAVRVQADDQQTAMKIAGDLFREHKVKKDLLRGVSE